MSDPIAPVYLLFFSLLFATSAEFNWLKERRFLGIVYGLFSAVLMVIGWLEIINAPSG